MVTVQINRASSWPDRAPVVVSDLMAGVWHAVLPAPAPTLGGIQYAVLFGSPGPDFGDEDDDEDWDDQQEEDDEDSWEGERFQVRTEADVPSVAEQLAELAKERAQSFGDKIATVDVLLSRLGDSAAEYFDVRRAAVLAAAGRYEEASRALTG